MGARILRFGNIALLGLGLMVTNAPTALADACTKIVEKPGCDAAWISGACEWKDPSGPCRPGRGPLIMKPELRLADQGDDVIAAQKLLKMEGMNIQVDGVFGEKTMEAVRTFQKDKGLPDTGKVDRATRDELLSEGRKRLPSR